MALPHQHPAEPVTGLGASRPVRVVVVRPTHWGNSFRVGATYMVLAGEEDRSWPAPASREPDTYDDGVRVLRCPGTATAVA